MNIPTSTTIPQILEDSRPIKSAYFNMENEGGYVVGSNCTEIRAYGEPGEYCLIPWLAIYEKDEIRIRAPALSMIITYDVST